MLLLSNLLYIPPLNTNAFKTIQKTLLINNELDYQKVIFFLQQGIGPNIQRIDGVTPLFVEVTKNSYTMVELLLENKANPNLITNNHISPLQLALKSTDFSPSNY